MKATQTHVHWISSAGDEGSAGDGAARFPYWSFTKTVIAYCALRLAEDGALDLEAGVAGLPEGVTLHRVLGHTAGLPDYGSLPAYHADVEAGATPWARDTVVERAMAQGMRFPPGQGWAYSNIGYLLAREALETAMGVPFRDVVAELVTEPLGLPDVSVWETRAQGAGLHWPQAAAYDPGWVYHGCLIGTARDAARLLDGMLADPARAAALNAVTPLGGAIEGRPWTRCGYGLGLMSGEASTAGRAMGHSGAGPFCVNAIYHFPDAATPVTVAAFSDGWDEGVPEWAAVRTAAGMQADVK